MTFTVTEALIHRRVVMSRTVQDRYMLAWIQSVHIRSVN